MPELNSKDVAAVVDVISYEHITAEEAKDAARAFARSNTILPDEKRLFLSNFYSSEY